MTQVSRAPIQSFEVDSMPSLVTGFDVLLIVAEEQALLIMLGRYHLHIAGEGDNTVILLSNVRHDVKISRIRITFPKPI
jgi:hypothetical protein